MIRISPRVALVGAGLLLGLAQAGAQTTNLVQNFNIALTGFAQTNSGVAFPVRVTNKDVLSSLNGLTGTNPDGSGFTNNFGGGARLVVANPVDDPSILMVLVRQRHGRTNDDTDISSFFTPGIGTVASVERATTNRFGRVTGNEYDINTFTFSSPTLVFNLQGFTTRSLVNSGMISTVNGPGLVRGGNAVLQGMISTLGGKVEVWP